MRKRYIRARLSLVALRKQEYLIGWKKAMSVTAIIGALIGGISGTAQAMTPSTSQGFHQDASLGVPKSDQLKLGITDKKYFSTSVERNRSSVSQPLISGTATVAATRCPAFASWEDWGGTRVHAHVDFRASDLCNGRHVKVAYVRLIRQCGPYFDTGRIYTYTASSASDTTLYSVSAWIFDSPIWSCNTNTYYGYDYF